MDDDGNELLEKFSATGEFVYNVSFDIAPEVKWLGDYRKIKACPTPHPPFHQLYSPLPFCHPSQQLLDCSAPFRHPNIPPFTQALHVL